MAHGIEDVVALGLMRRVLFGLLGEGPLGGRSEQPVPPLAADAPDDVFLLRLLAGDFRIRGAVARCERSRHLHIGGRMRFLELCLALLRTRAQLRDEPRTFTLPSASRSALPGPITGCTVIVVTLVHRMAQGHGLRFLLLKYRTAPAPPPSATLRRTGVKPQAMVTLRYRSSLQGYDYVNNPSTFFRRFPCAGADAAHPDTGWLEPWLQGADDHRDAAVRELPFRPRYA